MFHLDAAHAGLIGAGVALCGVLATLRVRRAWRSLRARRRARRFQRGERAARRLLERAGYRILDGQAFTRWAIEVDDQHHEVELRADYLVTRRGRLFVAEAKTGALAPSAGCVSTRRQLLEYLVAYGASGVLLVDAEAGRIAEVVFPGLRPAPAGPRIIGAALLAGSVALLLSRL